MPARKSPPQPWPMRWIVIAIIVCIVPYTWITLRHRKEGPAYLPYADNKARAEVARLLDAGYRRVELPVARPADRPAAPLDGAAAVEPRPGGLPPLLSEALIDKPLVPATITAVRAPAAADHTAPYVVRFECTQPPEEQISRALLFLRGREITLVPTFETLEGELRSRTPETAGELVVPGGTLDAGNYRVTLVGARESRAWQLELR